ncbi:AraC family ligand binding domain-containing protein [Flavobacterium sp. 3HN19-14]|uniref:AraC family ligand binding domain-containing protein n=1 Tax=Flavobacterium sp. 3HN19-14 TaxID=3448133 RepID=UPI003EE26EE0
MKTFPVYSVENFSCRHTDAELYVNTFGEHLKTHPFVEQPHRHDSHLLVFFTNGSGKHEVDFDVFEVHSGSLFVLQPGQMHNWELSADIEGYIVIFSSSLYNWYFGNKRLEEYPFYEMHNANPQLLIAGELLPEIESYFNLLVKVSQENQPFRQDKTLNILDCIHIEMMSHFQFQSHGLHTYNSKIKQFSQLLETHFRSEKSASFYASKLNITLKHLNRICQETFEENCYASYCRAPYSRSQAAVNAFRICLSTPLQTISVLTIIPILRVSSERMR